MGSCMTDNNNGVRISNREIYDAVQGLSAKLDQHITEHRVKDSMASKRTGAVRHRVTTWVASAAVLMSGATALVEFLK